MMCMEIINNGRYAKNNENISFSRFFNIRFFSHNCSNNTLLFGMLTFPFVEKWSETEEKAIEKCVQEGQSYEHCESVHS